MVASKGLTIAHNNKLFGLLKLKKQPLDKLPAVLDELILETEAVMDKEDVAWVEKKVAQVKIT